LRDIGIETDNDGLNNGEKHNGTKWRGEYVPAVITIQAPLVRFSRFPRPSLISSTLPSFPKWRRDIFARHKGYLLVSDAHGVNPYVMSLIRFAKVG
jgi:hypothetical protein